MASHEDKRSYNFSHIDKARWEAIFGKEEDRIKEPLNLDKKNRVRRDKEDFMNRDTKWV